MMNYMVASRNQNNEGIHGIKTEGFGGSAAPEPTGVQSESQDKPSEGTSNWTKKRLNRVRRPGRSTLPFL